jgi:hypothetical protein
MFRVAAQPPSPSPSSIPGHHSNSQILQTPGGDDMIVDKEIKKKKSLFERMLWLSLSLISLFNFK